MPLKGVTFDLDDTLWDGRKTIKQAENVFLEHLAANYPRIAKERFQKAFQMVMNTTKSRDFTILREKALEECALESNYDVDTLISSCMNAFLTARSSPILFDDVECTILSLQEKNIKLGVVTNGNCQAKHLSQVVQNAFADCWVAPDSVGGLCKPHQSIFTHALSLMELDSSHVVHIGDDYKCDIVGAKEAGMRTIWVTNESYDSTLYPHADAIVTHVKDILPIVSRWTFQEREV